MDLSTSYDWLGRASKTPYGDACGDECDADSRQGRPLESFHIPIHPHAQHTRKVLWLLQCQSHLDARVGNIVKAVMGVFG